MSVHVRQTVRNSSRSIAFWVVVGTAMIATLVNLGSSRGWFTDSLGIADENRSPERTKSEAILREGTPVTDWVGTFNIVGDRVHFAQSEPGSQSIRCLENLMLQRVYQAIRDEDRETRWIVHGKMTEYLGENYLLIERVVRAPRN